MYDKKSVKWGRSSMTNLSTANISHLFSVSVMKRTCNVSDHEGVNIRSCTGNDLWVRL
ncbi:hypothetical protein CY34DRAFT_659444 [Suillus luteus UH-Slu-Lm8-n1]|uniref:Uncharacterized protein n=1 Tax=Suillus luteus UH-Slu-Lm8-n1 TaxID=930992 RepID=A0A0D0AIM5_9AGAM|nr:hypothetical protein CY34DRAFT_659444 [Suillus luteus UH-Slu-Lm8-n1]